MHPQHTTNRPPRSAEDFILEAAQNLQDLAYLNKLNIGPLPRHRAILAHAASQSRPFSVRPAPMPQGKTQTGRAQ